MGDLQLQAGVHQITIKPVEIKTELMKLLEVQLIPVR
jgi:hypothetical protein